MRCALIFFLILIPAVSASSKELIKDGFYDERSPDGVLVRTVQYSYGQPNGRYRTYYPDGRIDGAGEYLNGKLSGMSLGYWPDGTLKIKAFYRNGKLHGQSKLYYQNGKVQAEITYIEGVLDGFIREYDELGRSVWERHYVNGKEDGRTKQFYPASGALFREYVYKQGWEKGYNEFYENGHLKGTYESVEDKELGMAKEFYETGELLREGPTRFNRFNGLVTVHYPIGKVRSRVNFTNGVMDDSAWREFYDTGELWNVVAVTKGKKQGKAQEFYRNGILKSEGTFKDNRREGIFKFYDDKGLINTMDYYDQDRLLRHQEYNQKGKMIMEQIYYDPS